jgi:hypothetical protein
MIMWSPSTYIAGSTFFAGSGLDHDPQHTCSQPAHCQVARPLAPPPLASSAGSPPARLRPLCADVPARQQQQDNKCKRCQYIGVCVSVCWHVRLALSNQHPQGTHSGEPQCVMRIETKVRARPGGGWRQQHWSTRPPASSMR